MSNLSPYEQDHVSPKRSPWYQVGRALTKVAWLGCLAAVGLAALEMSMGFSQAQSAPQQAAVAAMASSYVVVPYVFARALDHLTR